MTKPRSGKRDSTAAIGRYDAERDILDLYLREVARSPLLTPAQDLFMANLSIAYRSQVRYPGNVEVGTGIKKLGRTSITLGHAVHRDDGVLAAEAESVIVLVDRAAGKSEPISDALRAILGSDALAVKA